MHVPVRTPAHLQVLCSSGGFTSVWETVWRTVPACFPFVSRASLQLASEGEGELCELEILDARVRPTCRIVLSPVIFRQRQQRILV